MVIVLVIGVALTVAGCCCWIAYRQSRGSTLLSVLGLALITRAIFIWDHTLAMQLEQPLLLTFTIILAVTGIVHCLRR